MGRISATDLKARLLARAGEVAVLDVREESQFGEGHLMAASSAPLSGLEVEAPWLVPRRSTPIVVCSDGHDGLAMRTQTVLRGLGYTHVMVLDAGLATCRSAELGIFSGLNTPSKVLAAYIQNELKVPEISPEVLASKLDSGEAIQVLDCRPPAEYAKGTIPGAINCPGGDLPRYVAHESHRSCTTVITCAGRSRGLTGAQLLKEQNFTGTVFALERGTMGWELSGRQLETGACRAAPILTAEQATGEMLENARGIREQHQIACLRPDELRSFLADGARTTVLFDVRNRPEYEAEHIEGARHVAGGQLIHNIDMHIATRGARLVLCDDNGVRATSIALWLKRMGWDEVFVARMSDGGHAIHKGLPPVETQDCPEGVKHINPAELDEWLQQDKAVVLDLENSRKFRKGHIPGAWFCKRGELVDALSRFANDQIVVITSEDGRIAMFAAHEHAGSTSGLCVLEGGTVAWQKAGYGLAIDMERLVHAPDDVCLKPSEHPIGDARINAMQRYLEGTQEVLSEALRDGTLALRALPVQAQTRSGM